MNTFLRGAAAALTLIACAGAGHAQIFSAYLDGPSEAPSNASPGTGNALVTLDTVLNTMRVQVTFTGLLAPNTAAHIHAATAAPFTGVAGVATPTPTFPGFPTGFTSGTYDRTFDMTLTSSYRAGYLAANGGTAASAQAALFGAIGSGRAYLNVHSSQFPGGEIRGFLVAVPEPGEWAAMGVLGAGLVGLVARGRRRRAA